MGRELALRPAWLFDECWAKTNTKTKLFSRVIWRSKMHRDIQKSMPHYWMDLMCTAGHAMTCGWNCAGLPQQLQRCGTVVSDSSMSQSIHVWRIELNGLYCYMHGCSGHVFHDRFICRRLWRFDAAPILRETFRDHIFWSASVSDEHSRWP